jgi:hypothetical protein
MMSTTTHLDATADVAQQLEIDALGVVLRLTAIDSIEEGCFCPPRAVRDRVQRARGAHQLENLLADAVHIDGERKAAEADERYAKFLLAQDLEPSVRAIRVEIMEGERAGRNHSCRHSIMVAVSIHIG